MAQLATQGALIPLTIPEICRLGSQPARRIVAPPAAVLVVLQRSCWRRLHQARAMRSLYHRRNAFDMGCY